MLRKNKRHPGDYLKATQNATRKLKQYTNITNKKLSRSAILSSGRQLPSAKGTHLRIYALCEHSFLWLQETTKERDEQVPGLTERYNKLLAKYKHEQSRLRENPNYYSIPKRIKEINSRHQLAKASHEFNCKAYKRTTGHEWKPKVSVNAPIE